MQLPEEAVHQCITCGWLNVLDDVEVPVHPFPAGGRVFCVGCEKGRIRVPNLVRAEVLRVLNSLHTNGTNYTNGTK